MESQRRTTAGARPWVGRVSRVWGTAGRPVWLEQEMDAERGGKAAELERAQAMGFSGHRKNRGFYPECDASRWRA